MTAEIDITVADGRWTAGLEDPDTLCRGAALAALAAADVTRPGGIEISLVLADDRMVQRLNRKFRDRDKPTNVLSFRAEGGPAPPPPHPVPLGDVVLAFETVADEARSQGKALAEHVSHLIVHGVLHLAGYDHEDDDAANRMEAIEVQALGRLGIRDPYRVRESA